MARPLNLRRLVMAAALAVLVAACGRGLDDSLAGTTTSTAPATTTTTTLPDVEVVTTTTTPEVEPNPVAVWVPPEYVAAVRAAADAFTEASGVAVEVVPLTLDDIRQRAAGGFAATDPPDLFVGEHTWLGELRAADLVRTVGLDTRSAEFVAIAADAFRSGGELYGAPFSLGAVVLYRNPDLAPAVPTGMSQIKDRCEELVAGEPPDTTTTTADGATTTTAASTTTTEAASGFALDQCLVLPVDDPLPGLTFITATGGYLVGRDDAGDWDAGDVGLGGDPATEGAGFLAEVVQEDFVSGASAADARAGFATGTTPYLFAGPETRAALGDAPFAVSLLPLMGANTPVAPVAVRGFYLNAGGDRAEAAGVLLRDYLAAVPAMAALAAADELAPAYGPVAADLGEDDFDAVILASAERGAPLPAVAGIDGLLAAVRDAVAAILEPAGGDDAPTVAEIMDLAAEDATAALAG